MHSIVDASIVNVAGQNIIIVGYKKIKKYILQGTDVVYQIAKYHSSS